jgi:hypothetical protein
MQKNKVQHLASTTKNNKSNGFLWLEILAKMLWFGLRQTKPSHFRLYLACSFAYWSQI